MNPSVFDAHVDTLLCMKSDEDFIKGSEGIQFDEPRGVEAGVTHAVMAICAEAAEMPMKAFQHGLDLYARLEPVSKIRMHLMLEGCQPLTEIHRRDEIISGLSVATLTWNGENALGGGIGSDARLSPLGLEIATELDRAGVILDVSHLCDRSRKDLLDTGCITVATHCNCRDVFDCARNLPDADIIAIAASGGVVGVTLVPDFLGDSATLETVARHLEHIASIAGMEHAGFGSDFDGTRHLPAGVSDCTFWPEMFQLLSSRGWSDDDISAVAGDNWRRLFPDD